MPKSQKFSCAAHEVSGTFLFELQATCPPYLTANRCCFSSSFDSITHCWHCRPRLIFMKGEQFQRCILSYVSSPLALHKISADLSVVNVSNVNNPRWDFSSSFFQRKSFITRIQNRIVEVLIRRDLKVFEKASGMSNLQQNEVCNLSRRHQVFGRNCFISGFILLILVACSSVTKYFQLTE